RLDEVTGREIRFAVGRVPRAGPPQQPRLHALRPDTELAAEQLAEESVIDEPAGALGQLADEHAPLDEAAEHRGPIPTAGQGGAQRAVQLFEHRRLDEELPDRGRLATEDLVAEEGDHIVI